MSSRIGAGGPFLQPPDFSVHAFDGIRQAIIDGIVSAQSEGTGWNALRSSIPVTAVVRTSDTVVTITLPALPTYDITAQETITVTVPAVALAGGVAIVATPTFTVSPTTFAPPPFNHSMFLNNLMQF